MSKKILEFRQDAVALSHRANACYEKGDYPAALDLLFLVQKKKPSDWLLTVEISRLYGDMGLFDCRLRLLIRLLSKHKSEPLVYKEIIKCYTDMELYDQAFVFYRMAVETLLFDDEELLEDFFELEIEEQSKIRLLDKRDNSSLMQFSRNIMLCGDLEFARQLMETITSESYQYIEAQTSLAIIALSSNDAPKALDYCNRVLAIDEDNVSALSNSILAYEMMGDETNKQQYLERLTSLDLNDSRDLSIVVFCLQRLNNTEMTLHYSEKLLKLTPYSRENLICCAITNSNLGNKARARELLIRALRIYPDDVIIKYYSKLIFQSTQKTDLQISHDLPESVANAWMLDVLDFIKTSIAMQGQRLPIDEELYAKLLWVYQTEDKRVLTKLTQCLIIYPDWEEYIRGLLLDHKFDFQIKTELLHILLGSAKVKSFDLFVSDAFNSFRPRIPKGDYCIEIANSYWRVYATLAFVSTSFDSRLNKAFSALVEAASREENAGLKIDWRPMSALLLYKVSFKQIFKTKKDCCDMFGCDITDFDTYNEIFSKQQLDSSNNKTNPKGIKRNNKR